MTVTAVIAEYNPFHTGHEYHLRQAREITGADFVIVLMSPDFVQRGEPAIIDKYTRTQMALKCGADLVLELPIAFATGSAEFFASGAVHILNRLGCVDYLCFGTETNEIDDMKKAAALLANENEDFQSLLQQHLKNGLSFPAARTAALKSVFPDSNITLDTPNNILGIEYCKALLQTGSPIQPVSILREGNDYHSTQKAGRFCSATAIRQVLMMEPITPADSISLSNLDFDFNDIVRYIPDSCRDIFRSAASRTIAMEDFLPELLFLAQRTTNHTIYFDFPHPLSNRLNTVKNKLYSLSYREILELLKTKQITEARIRRSLLHLLLDLKVPSDPQTRFDSEYVRILGFRKEASQILSQAKVHAQIHLITKLTTAKTVLSPEALKCFENDVAASHLYQSKYSQKYGTGFISEYEHSPIIVD